MTDDLDLFLAHCVKAVKGKKATDLVVLDVRGLTSIADFFIICSGSSNRQVMAIAEFIQVDLKKHGITAAVVDGECLVVGNGGCPAVRMD